MSTLQNTNSKIFNLSNSSDLDELKNSNATYIIVDSDFEGDWSKVIFPETVDIILFGDEVSGEYHQQSIDGIVFPNNLTHIYISGTINLSNIKLPKNFESLILLGTYYHEKDHYFPENIKEIYFKGEIVSDVLHLPNSLQLIRFKDFNAEDKLKKIPYGCELEYVR